jgi:hypothetical protein
VPLLLTVRFLFLQDVEIVARGAMAAMTAERDAAVTEREVLRRSLAETSDALVAARAVGSALTAEAVRRPAESMIVGAVIGLQSYRCQLVCAGFSPTTNRTLRAVPVRV